jgi:hypothetical protein
LPDNSAEALLVKGLLSKNFLIGLEGGIAGGVEVSRSLGENSTFPFFLFILS